MTDDFFTNENALKSITENMYEAIALSHQFYLKLENAELYDEIKILRHQMSCCFKVLGAVANANEMKKYESGLNEKVFDVTSLIRDIVDNCRSKLRAFRISLEFSDCEPMMVLCDPDRFTACLLNIIVNSLQNIDREEGVVRFSVKQRGEYVNITVADNGYGVAHGEDISNYRSDSGLAVINRFCESVGTTPIFETGENSGFSVSLRLPMATDGGMDIASRRAGLDLGTFSPVNIYLAKVDYINISYIC